MTTCLNCGEIFTGNYCPNCGQSKKTSKVNWSDHLYDFQHFLHLDNYLFYTSWSLLKKPTAVIKAYLDGKRVKHYGPLSTALVIAGIYGLIFYLSGLEPFNLQIQIIYVFHDLINKEFLKLPTWILENYAFLELIIFLPIFSIASYIAFLKAGKTFAEHLAMSAFIASLRLLVGIICFPILFLTAGTFIESIIEVLVNLIELGLTFHIYMSLVNQDYVRIEGFLRTTLLFVIVLLELLLITWAF